LAQCGERLAPEVRIELLRQITEVVRFAHDKRVVHRGLSPQSILVVDPVADHPQIKVFNWQVGYRTASSTTGVSGGQVTGTIHVEQLVDDASTVYMAPEALCDHEGTGEHLDIFSLGAIAYHLFSGQAPAANTLELSDRLRETKGLQISSVVNGAGENLQFLVQYSTHPDVTNRIDSVRDFLEYLDEIQKELLDTDHDVVENPAKAQMGDKLPGNLLVKKRLGSGACSVALLVEKNNQELVLKVASSPEHNDRLRGEGEVLQKLHRHQHIVEHLDTVEIGDHVCLLMRRAGTETLGDRLGKEGRLHVDLLQRFGEDLLQVVVFLEEQGIPHRDIKPHNIGVGKVGRGDKLHLVLFDFSLSRTSSENVRAGTAGYLEPFLAQRKPARWDLHAERYATAVTLYELAAGSRPKWGDGKSDPAMLECEATIDAELFDANLREPLSDFFTKSLRRDPAKRYDNAEEMLLAWRECFRDVKKPASTDHEDWEQIVQRLNEATPDTQIAELGLGTSATDALDRVNVLTVRGLLSFSGRRVNRLRGIANKTRRNIAQAVKILRDRLGGYEPPHPTTLVDPETEAGVEPAAASVDVIAERVTRGNPRARANTERRFLRAFLTLDDDFQDSWPSQGDVADYLGVTRGRIGQLAGTAQRRWRKEPLVTRLRTDVADIVDRNGGVMAVEELAHAVRLARGSIEDEPSCSRNAMAATRAAVESERTMTEPRLVMRRDRRRVLVATTQGLTDYAVRLGREADKFAEQDPLAPPARVLERLRSLRLPGGVEPLSDARLLRVAAVASQNAAVSSRQEIYPRGMEAIRALKLSQGALLGTAQLTVEEIRQRVSGRYAEAAPLPDRPELDELLKEAGFEFKWDAAITRGGAYRTPARELLVSSEASTALRRVPTEPGLPVSEMTPEIAQARQFEERLQRAIADGTFVAMTVGPGDYLQARQELCRRFAVEPIDVEATFIRALRDEADKATAQWDIILKADAVPGNEDWNRLMVLVRRAVPRVEATVMAAEKTVLMVFPGLLARYEQMDLLARVREKIGRPDGVPGLWMLIPSDAQTSLPVMDGKAVPVIGPAEWARIPESWLRNLHRSNGNGESSK